MNSKEYKRYLKKKNKIIKDILDLLEIEESYENYELQVIYEELKYKPIKELIDLKYKIK